MEIKEKNKINLGTDNVGKLLFKLALPAIIAQIVNVLYNIVDRIFIGTNDRWRYCYGWSWNSISNNNNNICL